MSELEQKILDNDTTEAFLEEKFHSFGFEQLTDCLLYTSPSPRD